MGSPNYCWEAKNKLDVEVAEFVATCRGLEQHDFSSRVSQNTELAFAEMSLRYAMPPPPRVREPGATWSSRQNRKGQWHELVQHLTDLAYLTPDQFVRWHGYRMRDELPGPLMLSVVVTAALAFVEEDDYPEYRLLPQVVEPLNWVENYLSLIVYRAESYTSFDGDLSARPEYVVGSHSAFGRSLAYRMRVYFNLYGGKHSARRKTYFDRDLFPLLYSLDNSLGGAYRNSLPAKGDDAISVTVQELLLNGQRLFDDFRTAKRFGEESGRSYFLAYELGGPLTESEDNRLERLRRRASKRLADEHLHQHSGANHLGVRLLQMGLWRAGFYTGVLDGAFGRLTHLALLEMIAQELEQDGEGPGTRVLKPRQLQKLLVRTGEEIDGVWLVDLRLAGRLLDAYAPPSLPEARGEEDRIWSRIREEGLENRIDREFTQRQQEILTSYGDTGRHPDRRVYYGLRGLLRGAFRAVARIVNWIAGTVRAVVGAVFDFVKAVIKQIQQGVGNFLTGLDYFLRFALGKPLITIGSPADGECPVMATTFRIDMDVTSWVGSSASPDDLTMHSRYLREMGEGLAYFTDSVTSIISLVAGFASPLGWIRLGVLIARWLHDRIVSRNQLSKIVA